MQTYNIVLVWEQNVCHTLTHVYDYVFSFEPCILKGRRKDIHTIFLCGNFRLNPLPQCTFMNFRLSLLQSFPLPLYRPSPLFRMIWNRTLLFSTPLTIQILWAMSDGISSNVCVIRTWLVPRWERMGRRTSQERMLMFAYKFWDMQKLLCFKHHLA